MTLRGLASFKSGNWSQSQQDFAKEQAQAMFQASSHRFKQLGERWYAVHVEQALAETLDEPITLIDVLVD